MLELIQAAMMEWNMTHPPKRRRIGDAKGGLFSKDRFEVVHALTKPLLNL